MAAKAAFLPAACMVQISEDWVVEIIWTKLVAPHAVIEPVSETRRQERNFLLQRPRGELASFGSIAAVAPSLPWSLWDLILVFVQGGARGAGRELHDVQNCRGPASGGAGPVIDRRQTGRHGVAVCENF
jgi:hypothetical protein